ncbi:beta-ketoacyl synthase chain length factor [Mesonia sp. K7]|uniref:beta-ketoacyl synthase chain length factor n=1 Tax=Mesonia sp. K7 TaxID=2218606 RepID=UPI0013143F21|nr:beta-ketoacyl synthase chain length factor [Mesonia sp. K7]
MYINGFSAINTLTKAGENELSLEAGFVAVPFKRQAYQDYKNYIKGAALRRMSPSVKMSAVAAQQVISQANHKNLNGVIVGTGMGCKADSDAFLEKLLEDETLLSPTKFIQSTHNTVAGQLAILLDCKAYNMTFVQNSLSLESALIDAQLELASSEEKNILVGGVDELSPKTEEHLQFLHPESTFNFGEGAHFFMVANQKYNESVAQIKSIELVSELKAENLQTKINEILERNKLQINDIDAVILGIDQYLDNYYGILQETFHNSAVYTYKNKIGEFYTTNGFALWLACYGFKNQQIPTEFLYGKTVGKRLNNVLIYNQNNGKEHSFILVQNL